MGYTPPSVVLPPPTKLPTFSIVTTVIKHWPIPVNLKANALNVYEEYKPIDKPTVSAPLRLSLSPSPSPSPPPLVTVAVAVAVTDASRIGGGGSGRKSPRHGGRASPPNPIHHRLLQVPSPSVNGAESTPAPIGPLSPPVTQMNLTTTALPTTHLTLHAPNFDMQLHSVNRSSHSRSPPPSHPDSSTLASSPSRPSLASHSSSTSASSSSSKGQIHVKLISARGLNVSSIRSRPYVVVVFENNEFISRDPTVEGDKEVRGVATNLSRTSSSIAISALGAIGPKAATRESTSRTRRQSPVSSSSSNSAKSSLSVPRAGTKTPSNGLLGRMSPHNPVWKHEVSL
jgi:serine/threonine protein kinase SCH9